MAQTFTDLASAWTFIQTQLALVPTPAAQTAIASIIATANAMAAAQNPPPASGTGTDSTAGGNGTDTVQGSGGNPPTT